MPSSISSSDSRLPRDRWVAIGVAALIGVVLVLGSLEAILRAKGYEPCVTDDAALWALTRSVVGSSPDAVVLLGSSRMGCDINLDVFAETYGTKPMQLAVVHSTPIPILENLANDEQFQGLAVCEVSPTMFFFNDDTWVWPAQHALKTYESMNRSPLAFAEKQCIVFLQSHLVFLGEELQLEDMVFGIPRGRWPIVANRFRADRARFFDVSKKQTRYPEVALPEDGPRTAPMTREEEGIVSAAASCVNRIRRRGGDVVFVYLPCSGLNKVWETVRYPRQVYWDRLLAETQAVAVHADDDPELARYVTNPKTDRSHLDYRDAAGFTRRLAQLLKERLRNRESRPGQDPTAQKGSA